MKFCPSSDFLTSYSKLEKTPEILSISFIQLSSSTRIHNFNIVLIPDTRTRNNYFSVVDHNSSSCLNNFHDGTASEPKRKRNTLWRDISKSNERDRSDLTFLQHLCVSRDIDVFFTMMNSAEQLPDIQRVVFASNPSYHPSLSSYLRQSRKRFFLVSTFQKRLVRRKLGASSSWAIRIQLFSSRVPSDRFQFTRTL